jgi:serine/threonine protein kinase
MNDQSNNQPKNQHNSHKGATHADQPTIMSDLSGKPDAARAEQATKMTDLSGKPSSVSSTIVTKMMDESSGTVKSDNRATQATHLHVPDAQNKSTTGSGTHHNQIWGDFEIGDLLGRGGMGAVYRGRQISLDRPVAIKVLPSHLGGNENFRSRFLLEAKAVAQISSPHVISVFFAGVHDGHHYFAMEYVEGKDLSAKMRDGYKPTHREALELVTQAARGLSAAGELGIIHRDIKPANMMVTKKGLLKLMDFGLVRLARSNETGLTMAGTIMGTVSYFSPEQGRGERCDCRTDIYALGIVFYELLTGQLPFTGGDATSVIYQHIHSEPKLPKEIDPSIPENYQAVVLKCIQKNPDHRYQDANALIADLELLARGLEPSTAFHDLKNLRIGGAIKKENAFAAEKKNSGLFVAGIVAAIAVAGAGGWYLYQQSHRPAPITENPLTNGAPANREPRTSEPQNRETIAVPAAPDITAARGLLAAGSFDECRLIVDQARRSLPNDPAWSALRQELHEAQGKAVISQAEVALGKGDVVQANSAIAQAAILLPNDERVKQLQRQIETLTADNKKRSALLAEAETLLSEGNSEQVEQLLKPLVSANPADEMVLALVRRAKKLTDDSQARNKAVAERLQQGEEAMLRKDFDSALLHFTAAQQLEPKNERATKGLEDVTAAKSSLAQLREQFEAALKQRNLPEAQARLADMRVLAPGSSTLVLAENEFHNSKLVEENKAKAFADQQAAISAAAAALASLIDDEKQNTAQLAKAVNSFIAEHGEKHAQQAQLQTKLSDREQREIISAQLKALDQAVQQKNAAGMQAMVSDATFTQALKELSVMEGLVFESTLKKFTRTGDSAVVTVAIRHELRTFPERILMMQYNLARTDKGWRITQAALTQAAQQ